MEGSKKILPEELIEDFSLIKGKYYDLLNGTLSVSEFQKILSPILYKIISDRRYKEILGDTNINSINLLLINTQDKFNAYEYQKNLGNEQESRREQKDFLAVVTRLVNKLDDINDRM